MGEETGLCGNSGNSVGYLQLIDLESVKPHGFQSLSGFIMSAANISVSN